MDRLNESNGDGEIADKLDLKFSYAVDIIKHLPKDDLFQPSDEFRLKCYANFKQATIGPCNRSAPSRFRLTEYAKWRAWNDLENKASDDAKQSYIDDIKQVIDVIPHSTYLERFLNICPDLIVHSNDDDNDDDKDEIDSESISENVSENDFENILEKKIRVDDKVEVLSLTSAMSKSDIFHDTTDDLESNTLPNDDINELIVRNGNLIEMMSGMNEKLKEFNVRLKYLEEFFTIYVKDQEKVVSLNKTSEEKKKNGEMVRWNPLKIAILPLQFIIGIIRYLLTFISITAEHLPILIRCLLRKFFYR
ncbi:hypothetical protein SNEBB_005715 [Seison nebaliae]|nr:hypothetical protein SNEBB_005715 [Seison nebaliae]